MFNLAEVWGYRPDGSNSCRHIQLFPAGKSIHLISDEDMGRLFRQLDRIEAEGLESYVIPLAILHMLEAFIAGDRGFHRKPRSTGTPAKTSSRLE